MKTQPGECKQSSERCHQNLDTRLDEKQTQVQSWWLFAIGPRWGRWGMGEKVHLQVDRMRSGVSARMLTAKFFRLYKRQRAVQVVVFKRRENIVYGHVKIGIGRRQTTEAGSIQTAID
jgi:hypothetical protein